MNRHIFSCYTAFNLGNVKVRVAQYIDWISQYHVAQYNIENVAESMQYSAAAAWFSWVWFRGHLKPLFNDHVSLASCPAMWNCELIGPLHKHTLRSMCVHTLIACDWREREREKWKINIKAKWVRGGKKKKGQKREKTKQRKSKVKRISNRAHQLVYLHIFNKFEINIVIAISHFVNIVQPLLRRIKQRATLPIHLGLQQKCIINIE